MAFISQIFLNRSHLFGQLWCVRAHATVLHEVRILKTLEESGSIERYTATRISPKRMAELLKFPTHDSTTRYLIQGRSHSLECHF